MSPRTTLPRKIELSSSPRSFLLVSQEDGRWLGAYWKIREPGEDPGSFPPPSEAAWAAAVARGDVNAGAKREAWVRKARGEASLKLLVGALLGDSQHPLGSTVAYLEAVLS
jgi:hypothetical protein